MKLTKTKLYKMIKEEISRESSKELTPENTLSEGIDPADVSTLLQAMYKFATDPYTAPLVAAVVGGLSVQAAVEKYIFNNKQEPDDQG